MSRSIVSSRSRRTPAASVRTLRRFGLLVVLATVFPPCSALAAPRALQTGDLVFHTSRSRLALMIASVTRSPLTHVGVVVVEDGVPWVIEARGKVRKTSLAAFERRGVGRIMHVRRLRQGLDAGQQRRLAAWLRGVRGRPYDIAFRWGSERFYCSELAWWAYRAALGIELVAPQRKRDLYRADNPLLRRYVARYHRGGLRLDEPIVSPAWLAGSTALIAIE
jgi:hypothetical protein